MQISFETAGLHAQIEVHIDHVAGTKVVGKRFPRWDVILANTGSGHFCWDFSTMRLYHIWFESLFFGVSNGTVPRYCSYIYDIIQCCQAMCKSTPKKSWNYTFPLISNVWVPVFGSQPQGSRCCVTVVGDCVWKLSCLACFFCPKRWGSNNYSVSLSAGIALIKIQHCQTYISVSFPRSAAMYRLTSLFLYLPLSFIWCVDLQSHYECRIMDYQCEWFWIQCSLCKVFGVFCKNTLAFLDFSQLDPFLDRAFSLSCPDRCPSLSLVTGRTWGTALQSFGNLIPFAGRSSMELGGMVISRLWQWIKDIQTFESPKRFQPFSDSTNLESFVMPGLLRQIGFGWWWFDFRAWWES